MITKQSIEAYVDHKPTLVKQTFAILLDSKNPTTHSTLAMYIASVKVYLNRAGIATISKEHWLNDIFLEFEIDSLMDILSGESLKETKTAKFKLMRAAMGGYLDKLVGNALGLDFANLSHEDRLSVGDGV